MLLSYLKIIIKEIIKKKKKSHINMQIKLFIKSKLFITLFLFACCVASLK